MVPITDPMAAFPPELIASVAERAAEDANLVAQFLGAADLIPPEGGNKRLPARVLLGLGAAMRLLTWEVGGLDLARLGLPAPDVAVLDALGVPENPTHGPRSPVPFLSSVVFRFGVERLAWCGPATLGAEVLLDDLDEDALVEVLARYLWDRRHRPATESEEGS